MNAVSLELCRELYERIGWRDTDWFINTRAGESYLYHIQVDETYIPAYDLGYLLRKLPKYIGYDSQSCRFGLFPQGFTPSGASQWCASYDTRRKEIYLLQLADTPEDAVCKLAIELYKQGVLERSQPDARH